MKRIFCVVALIFGLSAAAWADYESGAVAFLDGDYNTAFQELKPIAEQGNANAQFFLGVMYGMGQGVRQDYAESLMWFRNSADQDNPNAQACLGIMYGQGRGVKQDYVEAAKWYRKAAEQGNANAQNNLASFYSEGRGVPKDYVQAYMWYNLAAADGFEDSAKLRDEVARKMTAKQIRHAQELARNWKPRQVNPGP
jgi:TPR repeat protein